MDVGLVCDSCSTFNKMGAKSCSRCGDHLSLDSRRPPSAPFSFIDNYTRPGIPLTEPSHVPCPSCGSKVISGHRFCGHCGSSMEQKPAAEDKPAKEPSAPPDKPSKADPRGTIGRSTMFFGAMQEARAKLVVIKGDGMDGVSFTLAGEEHLVGRSGTPILFEDDSFISPVHANFFYDHNKLRVRDEGSTNGIYIRIRGSMTIEYGTRFLVGEQVLEVQAPPATLGPEAIEDGTYYFASPPHTTHFRIVQELLGGATGMTYHARKPVVTIGREGNDINFPDDPFISGKHAQLSLENHALILADLDSKNGTFLRIRNECVLEHGDYVFMGQQLLRVEIV